MMCGYVRKTKRITSISRNSNALQKGRAGVFQIVYRK